MAELPKAADKEEYEKWFNDADKNKDGALTAKELKVMFKARAYKTNSKQFKQHFSTLDQDGDKKVTLGEYLVAMGELSLEEHKAAAAERAAEAASKAAEALPKAKDKEEYERWFNDADKNKDGALTSKELKAMFKARGYKTKSKEFNQHFANLDQDKDKKITLAEYLVAMGEMTEQEHREAIRDAAEKKEKAARKVKEDNIAKLPKAKDKEEYEKWFNDADKNKDGFLTAKELKVMFKARAYKTNGKQFKTHFADLDSDGDKKITVQEYLTAMGQIPLVEHKDAEIRKAFEEADKNGDGTLDLDEAKAVLREINTDLTNKELFDIMHKADKDGSGTIDYDEYLQLLRKEQADSDSDSSDEE